MVFQACEIVEEPTCEELQALELERAQREYDRICDGDASMNDLLRLFVYPPHRTDADDQNAALARYLTTHELCRPTNHAAVDCTPCEEPIPTGCPDPEQCPSKFYGYGLLEVILAAIRADSMAYIPIRDLDLIEAGEALVWHPTAEPDNPNCDPCAPSAVGAFVPQSVYDDEFPGG